MPCKDWNDEWVAELYGELETDERRVLSGHLERCTACRTTMAELARSRELLQAATPPLPATPRVVVLRPRSAWPGAWAFAFGAACAVVILALGMLAAPRWYGPPAIEATRDATTEAAQTARANAALVDQIRHDLAGFEQRLASLESRPDDGNALTADDLRHELVRLEDRFQQVRARDLEFLMGWINESELRTGSWMDQAQDQINLLAMRQDREILEQ